MKKFTFKHIIMSFIIGALVMASGQALADNVSQIGKKVDGETAVYVNKERVSNAIIIKGKSYTPSRDVAEALGAKVEWKGSEGILISNSFTTDEEVAEYNEKIVEFNKTRAILQANIKTSTQEIERLEQSIAKINDDIKLHSGLYKNFLEERLVELEKQLTDEKSKLAQYEQELADLESSKQ